MADETITKKRVTMTNFIPNGLDENGVQLFDKHEAIDYVREDLLPAYLAAVKATNSWQQVLVSEEYDAGPARCGWRGRPGCRSFRHARGTRRGRHCCRGSGC
jgi:hypothetical protein